MQEGQLEFYGINYKPVLYLFPLSVLFYKFLGGFLLAYQAAYILFYVSFFHPILKDGLLHFGCVWLKASNVCAASR